MKKILFIFIILSPLISFSEEIIFSSETVFSGEIILPGGDQTDINNAILALGGSGTIIIKGNININSTVTIPNGITLEIFTGYKLIIGPTNPQVIIKGHILANLNQIFNTPVNHNLKIYNQPIFPEWFGTISYQNNSVNIDDVIPLKKGLRTISEGGTMLLQGSTYSLKSQIIVGHGITLEFINNSKLVIDSLTNPAVELKGIIDSKPIQIFETPVNDSLKIYNQPIFPEWFGKCEYQITDNFEETNTSHNTNDSRYIQRAINASRYGGVIILHGKYYRINEQINVDVGKLSIRGKKVLYSPFEGPTNNIMVVNGELDIVFNITANGVTFSDLNFTGYEGSINYVNKGANTNGIALNFVRKPDGTKDLDTTVKECSFLGFKVCVYGEGTNLKIIDNQFVASYMGINLNEPKNTDVDMRAQIRGHVIDRNRFHSMGSYKKDKSLENATCIKIWGDEGATFDPEDDNYDLGQVYTLHGYYNQITNNYADDCKTFFEGSVDRTKIDNNSILTSGGTAIKAFGGNYGIITNNIIDGSFTWNPHRLFYYLDSPSQNFPSGHGIHVRFANSLTIHNNLISNKREHGIYIEKSHNSSIQLNTILNFNRHRFVKIAGTPGDVGLRNQDYDNSSIETPNPNASKGIYSGIFIARTDIVPNTTHRYNIQNTVSNNTINIPHTFVEGKYGIYVGDGDAWNLVGQNFITDLRLFQDIKIENP
ncbi:MAG TPA: hypothetical protein DCX41_07845 [Aequorivita sp.]|nr:hypothetical protein [Pusillimonas sp.]HAV54823.1 hypothetical protein [Aequorivita sp.]|tara:strand:+ start:5454 stop:7583 length:2130 start_codon:yes stop_codon:yes gene_type:complete